jgi:hypothetical protein
MCFFSSFVTKTNLKNYVLEIRIIEVVLLKILQGLVMQKLLADKTNKDGEDKLSKNDFKIN